MVYENSREIDESNREQGVLCVLSGELSQPMTDTVELRCLPARMRRMFGALLADLKPVDAGSLDVLVYCRDDLAGSAPGEWGLAGGVEGP